MTSMKVHMPIRNNFYYIMLEKNIIFNNFEYLTEKRTLQCFPFFRAGGGVLNVILVLCSVYKLRNFSYED